MTSLQDALRRDEAKRNENPYRPPEFSLNDDIAARLTAWLEGELADLNPPPGRAREMAARLIVNGWC